MPDPGPDAAAMMSRLATAIDTHSWDELPGLLHDDFVCRYVHTGETFDRASWVQLNADYPGFDRLILEDCISTETRAAGRSHVTGYNDGELHHFEVATFITVRDGFIADMTEVWTDVNTVAPAGTRPPADGCLQQSVGPPHSVGGSTDDGMAGK